MAVSIQPPSVQPVQDVTQPEAEAAAQPGFAKRLVIVSLVILLVIAISYAYAWFNASRLSNRFIQDADANFEQGNYLDALVGYEEFDPQTNQYINRGGYIQVEKIWSDRYSWPVPPMVEQASQRSAEIINERLTIEDAENYIRAHTGRPAPYFGEIYLRLGELYEEEGDLRSATEIYESIPELFANRPDLIEAAQEHLNRLGGS